MSGNLIHVLHVIMRQISLDKDSSDIKLPCFC